MGYTVVDLLEKLIKGEQNGYEMYMEMAARENIDERIKAVVRVFAEEEKKHMEMYKRLKNQVEAEDLVEIDFDIYDKASKLISLFTYYYPQNISDVKELLRLALNFEKENLALIISIQGLLVRSMTDINSSSYNILTELMKEEEKHIRNIEVFLK